MLHRRIKCRSWRVLHPHVNCGRVSNPVMKMPSGTFFWWCFSTVPFSVVPTHPGLAALSEGRPVGPWAVASLCAACVRAVLWTRSRGTFWREGGRGFPKEPFPVLNLRLGLGPARSSHPHAMSHVLCLPSWPGFRINAPRSSRITPHHHFSSSFIYPPQPCAP